MLKSLLGPEVAPHPSIHEHNYGLHVPLPRSFNTSAISMGVMELTDFGMLRFAFVDRPVADRGADGEAELVVVQTKFENA
jgi:hypothetical protein